MASKILQSDPICLRKCLLYEFLRKDPPIFESFRTFCHVMGDDAMEYREFEFWYYRFSSGNFDLIDDSEFKESSKMELLNLPGEMIGMIVESLEFKEQQLLRRVSKRLSELVDQTPPDFEYLTISSKPDHLYLEYDNTRIIYAGPEFEKAPVDEWPSWRSKTYHVLDKDYQKVCLDDLKISLKNPALKLKELEIGVYPESPEQIQNGTESFEDFGRLLQSIEHKCHVVYLNIFVYNHAHALSILPYLKEGVLKEFRINCCMETDKPTEVLQIDELVKTEQWKRAEGVWISSFKIEEPMESFCNFRNFLGYWDRVTPEMLRRLRDALSKSVDFDCYEIESGCAIEDVELIFGPEKSGDKSFIYPIPNSKDYLETETIDGGDYITIVRKSRN